MSIKKEYMTMTHTVTESVLIGQTRYCDVCNGVIKNNEPYWELTTHHHDWGNDSCESYEYFDICSEVCLREKFDEYMRESGKNNGNTMCFEVERAN